MDFRFVSTLPEDLYRYRDLFKKCFPMSKKFSLDYLRWLYSENPEGKVVGFDAYDGNLLVAHYACIPVKIQLFGETSKALLSLNTATHPEYQGKGLFTKLATMTYDYGKDNLYQAVFGVANNNSTHGFIKRLNFQLVCPLDVKVGFGSLGVKKWDSDSSNIELQRIWSEKSLLWRINNPSNKTNIKIDKNGLCKVSASTNIYPVNSYCEILYNNIINDASIIEKSHPLSIGPRIFLGKFPDNFCTFKNYYSIPSVLKPSPLNLVFLHLQNPFKKLSDKAIFLNFIDFDAY